MGERSLPKYPGGMCATEHADRLGRLFGIPVNPVNSLLGF
jgi:hypothetical protein